MSASWKDIEKRLSVTGLEAFAERELYPVLRQAETQTGDGKSEPLKALSRSMTLGFVGFVISFGVIGMFLPDNWWGETLRVLLFFALFFAWMLAMLWVSRSEIAEFLMRHQRNFLIRSACMSKLTSFLGYEYIPSPGGAPESLKILSRFGFLEGALKDIIATLDSHGGMDEAVETVRQSGLMKSDVVILGSKEAKARYYRQTAMGHALEDGISGTHQGIRFQAFEWIESVDEAPDIFHLNIILHAPVRLQGQTQLKQSKLTWPRLMSDSLYQEVSLVPEAFNKTYDLRSTDQVEARTIFNPAVVERLMVLSHQYPMRAVAREGALVIDIAGGNRFDLLDLKTGDWSDARLRQTMLDIAELLELIEALSHAFMVKAV